MNDYYQGVVIEHLRKKQCMFFNYEILLQLDAGRPQRNRHWFCDFMAIDLKNREGFLCEVTYSKELSALRKRLTAWQVHWSDLKSALCRDCGIESDWPVFPWVFLPKCYATKFDRFVKKLAPSSSGGMPEPKVTFLEDVVPWK